MKERYYLHGDQVEGKPEEFYCASCDLFVDRPHFDRHDNEPNRLNNFQKYLNTLKSWRVIKKRTKTYQRPRNPYNLFD
jgi:hypothetical protein